MIGLDMNNKIGFMQGRLTEKGGFKPQQFPAEGWQEEFGLAKKLGFASVEWMFNTEEWKQNPIYTENGINEINTLIDETGIRVSGICANYFMQNSIYDWKQTRLNIEILNQLLQNAQKINCPQIIIPLFEKSEFQNENERLVDVLSHLHGDSIKILFETNAEMKKVEAFLTQVPYVNVGMCYDAGNAAGLGRNVPMELVEYAAYIKEVHIKDKKSGGTTVMLGQGDVPFIESFDALAKIRYNGYCILESYYDNAVQDTTTNLKYVKDILQK